MPQEQAGIRLAPRPELKLTSTEKLARSTATFTAISPSTWAAASTVGFTTKARHSPAADGFRKDVLEAARGMHVSVLRWPGGNFSSGYNWKDGIGPKDARPRRWDTAWQEEESNRFGTDEFIEYCRKLGAEPYICVNMGTGTMQDAADWVEYCNATTDTYWANLRKKNGHAEPYNVKYWALGNEVYGSWQAGRKDVADYAAACAGIRQDDAVGGPVDQTDCLRGSRRRNGISRPREASLHGGLHFAAPLWRQPGHGERIPRCARTSKNRLKHWTR